MERSYTSKSRIATGFQARHGWCCQASAANDCQGPTSQADGLVKTASQLFDQSMDGRRKAHLRLGRLRQLSEQCRRKVGRVGDETSSAVAGAWMQI